MVDTSVVSVMLSHGTLCFVTLRYFMLCTYSLSTLNIVRNCFKLRMQNSRSFFEASDAGGIRTEGLERV